MSLPPEPPGPPDGPFLPDPSWFAGGAGQLPPTGPAAGDPAPAGFESPRPAVPVGPWRSSGGWQDGSALASVVATSAVRSGPLAHAGSASLLLGLAAVSMFGALVAMGSVLARLARADPAVRHLGSRDEAGSTAAGFLFLMLVFLVVGLSTEVRWTRRLQALRPPAAPAPPAQDGSWRRVRRWVIGTRLVALRADWTNAPDPTFDLVARLWALALAVILVLTPAAILASSFGDGPVARIGMGVGLVAGWLLLFAILVGWALMRRLGGLVERRAVLALIGRPAEVVQPDWHFRRSALLGVPVLACLLAGYAAASSAAVPDSVDCPRGGTGCHVVTVPFDRTRPDDGRSIDIVYRVAPSTGDGHRLLIVAVGGPGGSGLAEMTESRLDEIDPTIRDAYDIVFFDQRGVGASDGLRCPGASGDRHSVNSVSERESVARTFAEACVKETGHAPADMAVYATTQTADDVDAIRAALGVDRFVLYGESYGTRLAQTYAARHPERLDALILDGAIDPASDGPTFWAESAAGFDASLRATMKACTADRDCGGDIGSRDPIAVVSDLLVRAENGDTISIPTADGLRDEKVSRSELAGAMEDALYTERGRATLQRAISAAANGDTTILGRLVLIDRETSPEDRVERGAADDSLSVASYFAIECADYAYASGDAGAQAFAEARRQADAAGRILDTVVTQDLPCAYWPVHGQPAGSAPTPDVPTLVLAATADPVTPPGNAQRIVARLPKAALVLTEGGPHVTWRAGATCVGNVVKGLLLDRTLPGTKTTCADRVSDHYIAISPPTTYALKAIDALDIVYSETYALPEYDLWDGTHRFTVGCAYGGTVDLQSSGPGDAISYRYIGCGVFRNVTVDGTGTYDPADGAFHYDGKVGTDFVIFDEDSHGHRTITGTWQGQRVDDHD